LTIEPLTIEPLNTEDTMAKITASDGTVIHYRTWGARDRPALLLIQGLGCDAHGWSLQRLAFARQYHCIALDNRGVGGSDAPPGPYSIEQMARDARDVLDAEAVERAHVMGLSMGGVVSQLFAIKYPKRVRTLQLVATAGRHHGWRIELLAQWQYLAVRFGMSSVASAVTPWFIGQRARDLFGGGLALVVRAILPRSSRAFASQIEAILEVPDELRRYHADISSPTQIIVGELDSLTPPADSRELASRVPRSELQVLGGVGHALIAEAPQRFNRTVLRFLESHAS
jgi:3-oxoadipate enol-lactonase